MFSAGPVLHFVGTVIDDEVSILLMETDDELIVGIWGRQWTLNLRDTSSHLPKFFYSSANPSTIRVFHLYHLSVSLLQAEPLHSSSPSPTASALCTLLVVTEQKRTMFLLKMKQCVQGAPVR